MGNCCSAGEGLAPVADEVRPDSDESEEESDDVPEPAQFDFSKKGARTSVSAEAYGAFNKKITSFTAPVHVKTPEAERQLRAALANSFMFNALSDQEMNTVVGAFEKMPVNAGQVVIQQGDPDAKELYVLESGHLDIYKRTGAGGGDGTKLGSYKDAGQTFGELALLYNCPRAATIKAASSSVIWKIDRETFNHVVKDAAARKRQLYESFLKSVEILSHLDAYEVSQVADALKSETYKKGDLVVRQGDVGNHFFLLEEGSAVALKNGQNVKNYGPRDYFGELALMSEVPRQASVRIESEKATVLSLDRKSFKRLLGPLNETMSQKAQDYKKA
mmetsp:Transcript_82737/g.189136  ORF Transcript_82737/g.189136 Transcript_82737/m.189136 type:complete len:332 (+) Transcript_82737:74-1069(+)